MKEPDKVEQYSSEQSPQSEVQVNITGNPPKNDRPTGAFLMSENTADLFEAIAAAQAALKPAGKDAENTHFRSSYATLDAVIEAGLPVFGAQGVATVQAPETTPKGVKVSTMLGKGEQWLIASTYMPIADIGNPHKVGSAITYARRYGLNMAWGVAAEEDDDGNANAPEPKQGRPAPQAKRTTVKKDYKLER